MPVEAVRRLARARGASDAAAVDGLLDGLLAAGCFGMRTATAAGGRCRSGARRRAAVGAADRGLRCSGARVSRSSHATAAGAPAGVDLVVLADSLAADPRLVRDLQGAGVPHLPVRVRDGTGVVGPLVIPGLSSCLMCADLHRTDRDPAWPALAAQLRASGRHRRPADAAGHRGTGAGARCSRSSPRCGVRQAGRSPAPPVPSLTSLPCLPRPRRRSTRPSKWISPPRPSGHVVGCVIRCAGAGPRPPVRQRSGSRSRSRSPMAPGAVQNTTFVPTSSDNDGAGRTRHRCLDGLLMNDTPPHDRRYVLRGTELRYALVRLVVVIGPPPSPNSLRDCRIGDTPSPGGHPRRSRTLFVGNGVAAGSSGAVEACTASGRYHAPPSTGSSVALSRCGRRWGRCRSEAGTSISGPHEVRAEPPHEVRA